MRRGPAGGNSFRSGGGGRHVQVRRVWEDGNGGVNGFSPQLLREAHGPPVRRLRACRQLGLSLPLFRVKSLLP
jgi:hypothetical protein